MSETKPSQAAVRPEEKPTVAMPPPPSWAIDVMSNVGDLKKVIADGFQAVDSRLTTIEGNQTLQGGQVLDIGRRMTEVERRVGGIEERQNTNSARVGRESDVNMKQDAAIAEVLTKVTALAARPDSTALVLDEIKSAAKTPLGQKLIGAVAGIALLGMGFVSLTLQAKMARLETKPETVQPAPTVYVPVPTPMAVIADGGAK